MEYYLLKTKGYRGTEDFVQIRSHDLALIANVRCKSISSRLDEIFPVNHDRDFIIETIEALPEGELIKIEL